MDQSGGGKDRRQQQRDAGSSSREFLYGRNSVLESLRAGRRRHIRLVVADGVESDERITEIEELAEERGVRVERSPRDRIESQTGYGHQGVMLEASPYPYARHADLAALAKGQAIILALDGVVDPRNAGTLLRTAEAIGVALVVVPSDRAVGVSPAVVNASSGAVEHLMVQRETNLARWLASAREAGMWVAGMDSGDESRPLFETDVAAPVVLVVGSEGRGIRRLVREQCDMVVSLPMFGKVESLNAAVAGSIALYEIKRDSLDAAQ